MFDYTTTVTLRDTDAFGLIYFTEQLNYCSEAFQAFLLHHNLGMPADLKTASYVLPVVHCESDFTKPLRLNDTVRVHINTLQPGTSSLTISYSLYVKNREVGTASITHVCIDTATKAPTPLPNAFKDALT